MESSPHLPRDELSIDGDVFCILVNKGGHHSLWPAGLQVPEGWTSVGPVGSKSDCLAYVEANWHTLHPHSLLKATKLGEYER